MYLLRHGQSEFNLHFSATHRDPGIEDPALTPAGMEQAQAAGRALLGAGVRRIVASPYRRALQTAHAAAAVLGLGVSVEPLVRERFAFVCDVGTPPAVLAGDWPGCRFDHLPERWWPERRESEAAVVARAAAFRTLMAQAEQEEGGTLLVSHWGFLLALCGRSLANGECVSWHPGDPVPAELVWA